MIVPPISLESEYVNKVYDAIAPHFSSTRFKAWPVVHDFLASQPPSSLGADIGCGNGKYIGHAKTLENKPMIIGCDRSKGLVDICVKERGFEVGICDACCLPYRDSVFDFSISIAVIHHFSTRERRVTAVRELLRITSGQILIFVWAMEQSATSKRTFTEQDNFVSWKVPETLITSQEDKTIAAANLDEETGKLVYQRFYHCFIKGELDEIVKEAGGEIVRSDYDLDNWFVVCQNVEKKDGVDK